MDALTALRREQSRRALEAHYRAEQQRKVQQCLDAWAQREAKAAAARDLPVPAPTSWSRT